MVLGPRGESADPAVGDLLALVEAGGADVAGAGVEVTGGFRTARLAGAGGDRRDGVLAALRTLGADGAARLGDRTGVLVALFGPRATKPVGAAATTALHDGRWGVLHLASAASDVLGPEQLERVLRLTGPHAHTADGRPRSWRNTSNGYSGGCRSRAAYRAARPVAGGRRPLRAGRPGTPAGRQPARRPGDRRFRERYRRLLDDDALEQAGARRRPHELARWSPREWDWHRWLNRAMHDALAATVLLRAAATVTEHGPVAGLAQVRPQLAATRFLLTRASRSQATQRVKDLAPVPARPGGLRLRARPQGAA